MTGLPILILAAAQAAAPAATTTGSGPAEVTGSKAATPAKPCKTGYPEGGEKEIVICVERQQGFRINPDLREAERQAKRKKLKRPERMVDNSCASVGPMGCRNGGGINLLAAALTAAEMAKRVAKGENVGEMFITDPQPDEYQLYREAKRVREARQEATAEAAKAATAAGPDEQ
jgi:hypothetical protein